MKNNKVDLDFSIKLYKEKAAFYKAQAKKYNNQAYEVTARELRFVADLLNKIKKNGVINNDK